MRAGGIIELRVNGTMYRAKGDFTYNMGQPKREAVMGADRFHGYKDTPQVAFVEGEITDGQDMKIADLLNVTDATVTLNLANGKVIVFRQAFFAGDGNVGTAEGNIQVRFEAASADEV